MAETIATPEDVAGRWLSSDPLPDDDIIQRWIDDAELLVFTEFPDLHKRIEEDQDDWNSRIVYVEVQLVLQALKNPDGVRQKSQTAGSFTESSTFGTETIRQVMELTPAHRAMLSGKGKKHVGIDMTPKHSTAHPLEGAWVNGPGHLAPGGEW